MKVKLIKYIKAEGLAPNTQGLILNKIYEVAAIIHFRELKSLEYVLITEDEHVSLFEENCFEIIENKIDKDFVVKNDSKTNSLYILPECICTSFFYDLTLYSDEIRLTSEFVSRFHHLFSQNKIAEVFPDKFQSPNIRLIAEGIGNSWVLCPLCDQAFEVNKNEGTIKCTGCFTKLNNPYALK